MDKGAREGEGRERGGGREGQERMTGEMEKRCDEGKGERIVKLKREL